MEQGERGGEKRKRRASIMTPTATAVQMTTGNIGDDNDELIDVDAPWMRVYVPITADYVPQHTTRNKLTRHA